MFNFAKHYDLTNSFPNVLLLGNGVIRSSSVSDDKINSWEESVFRLSNQEFTNDQKDEYYGIPYSIRASIISPYNDGERHDKYQKCFQTQVTKQNSVLHKLVSLPFDSILTTNYTYEIENSFYPQYSALVNKKRYAFTHSTQKDAKYLIHSYNKMQNSPEIWHIHGELRRKSSIILTHDEYARLVNKMIERNNHIGNRYEFCKEDIPFTSWIDYFILGNLHIVGLSMDFSEFDLWWLLNRRKRERIKCGDIFYYAFKNEDHEVLRALDKFGVHIIKVDIANTDKYTDKDYEDFYLSVTSQIKHLLYQNKKGTKS